MGFKQKNVKIYCSEILSVFLKNDNQLKVYASIKINFLNLHNMYSMKKIYFTINCAIFVSPQSGNTTNNEQNQIIIDRLMVIK